MDIQPVFVCLGILLSCPATTQSLKATLKCAGDMTVYIDGKLHVKPARSAFKVVRLNLAEECSLVAISCTPVSDQTGMRGYFSNGYMTDDTWNCSNKMADKWYQADFDDSRWRRAAILPASDAIDYDFPDNARHIWAADTKSTMYCRRKIDHVNLRVACMGKNLKVFADGVQIMDHKEGMDLVEVDLQRDPQLVAISCDMTSNPKGLVAAASNGLISDFSWKCSSRYQQQWHALHFDDSAWVHPYQGYYNKPGTNLHQDQIRTDAAWMWTGYHTYCRRRIGSTMRAMFDDSGVVYVDGRYRGKTGNKMEVWSYNLLPETSLISFVATTTDDLKGGAITTFSNDAGKVRWKCQTIDEHLWWTLQYNDSKWASAVDLHQHDDRPSQLSDLFSGERWISHSDATVSKTTNCRGRVASQCDCEYNCLRDEERGFVCTCPDGSMLQEDRKHCAEGSLVLASKRSSVKAIAAGVFTTIGISAILAAIVVYWLRRRHRKSNETKYRTLQVDPCLTVEELETIDSLRSNSMAAIYTKTTTEE